ncbi:MAG: hypothetical protein MJH11_01060 [Lentisphaeria bacterium]|nr:hypothetical protein [Lentisphaeria bacterium]
MLAVLASFILSIIAILARKYRSHAWLAVTVLVLSSLSLINLIFKVIRSLQRM